ncbi:hypothetical protein N7539_001937 [Penicillium diatomitis]|uniref:Uncharacterized protein n=1 Tax=Penicillium diatomitis TaxID=2819901 RepID=A0A9W9XHN5_9EURO|nr:uncharacterized protein N7539_001937 [Penicillium diatomitis]KAJ5493191.1 hypothetical protein N7539_001937 [Penicillium diatomitis]
MQFTVVAALASLAVNAVFAAPLASSQDQISPRKATYEVVNVAGPQTTSVAPVTETLTQTIELVTTATKISPSSVMVTVYATSKPASSPVPSSHDTPSPGASPSPCHQASSGMLHLTPMPTSVLF